MADKRKTNSEKKQKSQAATLKEVIRRLGRYRIFLVFSILLATVSVALTLYIPKLTGHAVDYVIGKGKVNFPGVMQVMIQIGVCTLITALAQWLMNVCNNKMTYQMVQDIRNEAFDKIEQLPLKYIDGHPYGEVVSRVIADVDQFSDGLLMGFTQLFTGIATIVGTFCFMLSVNVSITFVVVLITPVSFFVANFIAKRTFRMFRLQSEIRGEQTGLIDEMIGNQKVVQAFGRGEDVTERFDEVNKRLQEASLRATFFSSITNPATRFVNSLVYTGVGITGAFAVVRGAMSVGQLSSFLSYANQYTKPFNEISGVVTEFQNAIACAQRVFTLIDEEPQIPEPEHAVHLTDIDGNVKVEDVSFSYLPGQHLIEDFNLEVKPGQRIAIVGPTGCGKTTLINLLMRFYDVNVGSIKVEDIDIREMTRKSLRAGYGMVLQETWLKTGTIRENIAMGRPDATEEEMNAVLQKVNLLGFLQTQDGLQTKLLEKAGNLSGGQCQRLVIARALLKNAEVYIFDEATSNIDIESEELIMQVIHELAKTRTVLLISHRLANVVKSDQIYFLKDGEIKERGTHAELMEENGAYRHLYESQMALEHYGEEGSL